MQSLDKIPVMKKPPRLDSLFFFIFLIMIGNHAHGEAPTFTVTPLLKTTLTGDGSKEVFVGRAEFSPGASTGVHTHPGDEYATVLEGTLELRVQGLEVRRVSAGEAYHSPKNVVHETVNTSNKSAVVISTFVIDKGKPLVIPVTPE